MYLNDRSSHMTHNNTERQKQYPQARVTAYRKKQYQKEAVLSNLFFEHVDVLWKYFLDILKIMKALQGPETYSTYKTEAELNKNVINTIIQNIVFI